MSHGESFHMHGIRRSLSFNKTAYLLVLMLISVNFFHFKPIAPITDNDTTLVLFLGWLLAGHFLYKPPTRYLTLTVKRYYWPIYLIGLGVLISFIPARVLYGQSFGMSFITSRVMLSLLALPFLAVVKPSWKEIEAAAKVFATLLALVAILDALGLPILDRTFFIDEERPRPLIDEDSYVMLLPGFHWNAIALFFSLDRLKTKFTTRNLLSSLYFFALIFLLQNRSMLFICAVLFAYTFFTLRGKTSTQTALFRFISILIVATGIGLTIPQWLKLFKETASQLSNDDYNRILAYNYFLFNACPNAIYYFTGTGLISAKVSSIMRDLMNSGIYNSDVGMIGLWNHYGILPVIAVFYVGIKALRTKGAPLFIKFNAIFILIGSATIACFNTIDKILWLCTFIYLVYEKPEAMAEQPGREIPAGIQEYPDLAGS